MHDMKASAVTDCLTPRQELRARLHGLPPEAAELCRELDVLADEHARKVTAKRGETPADDPLYREVLASILSDRRFGFRARRRRERNMWLLQSARREVLWGRPMPSEILNNLPKYLPDRKVPG